MQLYSNGPSVHSFCNCQSRFFFFFFIRELAGSMAKVTFELTVPIPSEQLVFSSQSRSQGEPRARERDKSTTEEAVPSLAMSVVGLSSAHPLSFLFERLQLVKQSLTWLSRKRKLCLRRKDLALLGFDAFVCDLCYNFLTMLFESSLFNFAMTSFEDERGKGGNRKHKNRCLVSKLTTCNIVAAFKYVSQVVITEKWALFFFSYCKWRYEVVLVGGLPCHGH